MADSIRCDQCEAAMINGVFCHETGCPNSRKTWVEGRGWVRFVECWECGGDVEQGEACECAEGLDTDEDEEDEGDYWAEHDYEEIHGR